MGKETNSGIKKKRFHGMSNTKLFWLWCDMKKRCVTPSYVHYDRYGGRGISVCDEWKEDFMNFYNWSMANGYKEGLSIDRIDVDGDYEPSNCRWIPLKEQHWNTSQNLFLEHNGERKCLAQWCKELGVKYSTASGRIKRGKTDFEEIMFSGNYKTNTKEKRRKRNDIIRITISGETKPLTQWADELNLDARLVQSWKDRNGKDYATTRLAKIIDARKCGRDDSSRKYKYYYILEKDGNLYEFSTEQDACKFVGVRQASVGRCYREGRTCKGYTIHKLESFPDEERSECNVRQDLMGVEL